MSDELANNKQLHNRKIVEAEAELKEKRKPIEEKEVTRNGKILKRIKYADGSVKHLYISKKQKKKK